MIYPDPTDMAKAPVWRNYIICQALQASLGLLPECTVVAAVDVSGRSVRLIFQVTQKSLSDELRIKDIVDNLEDLVGPRIKVETECRIVEERDVTSVPRRAGVLYISPLED